VYFLFEKSIEVMTLGEEQEKRKDPDVATKKNE